MKKIVAFIFVLFVISCKHKHNTEADLGPKIHAEWVGNWVGDFVAKEYKENTNFSYINKINIRMINISTDNEVVAQSIVAGHKRKLTGSFNPSNNSFILKEPRTDKYDGIFEFSIANDTIKGDWKAIDTSLPVTRRDFVLTKVVFVYNKNLMLPDVEDYVDYNNGLKKSAKDEDGQTYTETYYRQATDIILKLNASTTLLKEEDLKNLKKLDLEIIRNTIFARHGYTFKKKTIRQFFDPVDWYVPMYDDVKDKLTDIELKNIAVLSRFEKYAEDNYDTFGR